VPQNPTQLAALAIDAHALFLAEPRPSDVELVAAITDLASTG
jgi:hypothetical protein